MPRRGATDADACARRRRSKRTSYAPRPPDFAPAPPGTEVRAWRCRLCAAGALTHALCAVQASKAWVEAFQPEFASLRAVRCPSSSLVCLRLATCFLALCADTARSRCAARSSTRKQKQGCRTRLLLRFATAPPGRRTASVRALCVCAPERRTRMQARSSRDTVLPQLISYTCAACLPFAQMQRMQTQVLTPEMSPSKATRQRWGF